MTPIDLETMKLPELKELQSAVESEILLRSRGTNPGQKLALFQQWYQAFSTTMLTDHGIQVQPQTVFSRQRIATIFMKALPYCEELVPQFKKPGGPVLRIHDEQRARCSVFRALFVWMEKSEVPIYVTSVCRNMQNAQAAIAAEFPGYVQNGLLHMLIK